MQLALLTRRQSLLRWLAVGGVLLNCGRGASPAASSEPEQQKESDWIDARWNQTDLGRFHASIVPLPNGTVAKGLSVRVGERGEATVVYDTSSATLRGGWTGGFLRFDGARYGLIHSPKPDGKVQFVSPAKPAWGDTAVRWRGLHVHGPRVVLDYEVAGTGVNESPWHDTAEGLSAFTRTLELQGSERTLSVALMESKEGKFSLTNCNGVDLAALADSEQLLAVAATGDAAAVLRFASGVLSAEVPARNSPRRLKLFLGSCEAGELPKFAALVKQFSQPDDLSAFAKPGPPRWQPLTTRGQRGMGNDPFVLDTLTMPYENPWKALLFASGVDFPPNGDAAVCTIHGDVWLVSGVDDKLERLTWRRFATGLFQPLGLRVRNGKVHVLGRDQITRLHDENGDGEADFYENFCNQIHTSTGGHDYVAGLETDTNGYFYYVDPRGVHRVSPDGAKHQTLAAGFRNPNGLGVSPDGTIVTVAPQEGEWTPSSAICEAKPGGWYGYGGPRVTPERPLGYDPPLCWVPHRVDNSGGNQLWVTSDQWGPLRGHLLHFSFGRCAQFLVLREVVDGVSQGAIVPLPGRFLSGAMRGAFHPGDGQLYVVGSRGWQTSGVRDGCLQRVRFTGAPPLWPLEAHVHSNGLRLTFAAPLDRDTAEDPGSYAASHWNYRYAAQYGSKDYSPSAPDKEGHDPLEVRAAKLLPDGRTVFLEMPGLRPVMQWELKYNLKTATGKSMRSELHGTIHRLAPAWREDQ
jgi:hypothetical protein